ncbi:cytosolic enolase [Actinidia rufa]|uniref:phosphopyruvate hydratase n=1 Tax=Actinidia rufa TaxID=165716 RepID=A0A7J0H9W5_9ERIC|nr:cytosolic enolase [Actinidia rufa]
MSVQEYLDKHMLSRKIDAAVNAAVRANTSDPVLFIVKARQILDSRGIPTVEVDLYTNKGMFRASAPSGVSSGMNLAKWWRIFLRTANRRFFLGSSSETRPNLVGNALPTVNRRRGLRLCEIFLETDLTRLDLARLAPTRLDYSLFGPTDLRSCQNGLAGAPIGHWWYEATELRDGDKGMYLGNSVQRAVKNINEKTSETLIGMDLTLQSQIDQAMIDLDKTEKVPLYKHISDLSGRTNMILPVPAFCLISGGKHAGNTLAIKDILILPVGARKFEEAMQMGSETYHHLKCKATKLLFYLNEGTILSFAFSLCNFSVYGTVFFSNMKKCNGKVIVILVLCICSFREGLDLVKEAISRTGYGEKIKIGIDVSALISA